MNTIGKIKIGNAISLLIMLSAVIAAIFYWLTCFKTFTWWDSSEYSVAALVLGVPHPPGSLLTVIVGWLVTKLPIGLDKFFTLNLSACLMAAIAVYLVGRLSMILDCQSNNDNVHDYHDAFPSFELGAALGALTFGVSLTMWFYAIRFTPYITTTLFTALIVLAMLSWRRHSGDINSHLRLGLVTLLFGLDFSIHRTNHLMLPGFLIWLWIFHPRALLSLKHWLHGLLGLAVGLSVQLFIIPIAAGRPFINFNDPSALSRFWDYITLKQYGGGWLVNILPRKASFFSVQLADYVKTFAENFANGGFLLLGYLPIMVGLAGMLMLFRRNWKLGLGLVVMFMFSSLGAVMYFNLPQDFFRSIDRHYMPSFLIFSIFIAFGAGALLRAVFDFNKWPSIIVAMLCLALVILMPVREIARNYRIVDGSKSYFAYDTARNFLNNLPQNSILFTQADIDTYTLWDLQMGEGFRPDVTVCNLSLMNTPWFIKQVQDRDAAFAVRLNDEELSSLSIIPWHDSTIALAVFGKSDDYSLPTQTILPDSIEFVVPPSMQNQFLLVQDQMIVKTILGNKWRRPIYFSGLIPESTIRWLKPNLRLEGLCWRLVPARDDSSERKLLAENLMESYIFRGFADDGIPKEQPTKWIGWNLCSAFLTLSSMQYDSGDTLACKKVVDHMRSAISPEKLFPPPDLRDAIEKACGQ